MYYRYATGNCTMQHASKELMRNFFKIMKHIWEKKKKKGERNEEKGRKEGEKRGRKKGEE